MSIGPVVLTAAGPRGLCCIALPPMSVRLLRGPEAAMLCRWEKPSPDLQASPVLWKTETET
jgi:hypothetical protein